MLDLIEAALVNPAVIPRLTTFKNGFGGDGWPAPSDCRRRMP